MKQLKDMTKDELLEFDYKHPVLSKEQFIKKKIQNYISTCLIPYSFDLPYIYNLLVDPSKCNLLDSGKMLSATIVIAINVIDNIKNKKTFTIFKSYQEYRQNLLIGKELTRLYNIFLDELIEEIDKLPFDKDPLSIAILVGDYLIPNGILSYTQNFHRINNIEQIIDPKINYETEKNYFMEGIYIIAGYGCCRHYNSLICDIFTKMGIKNDKLCCIGINHDYEEFKKELNFKTNHMVIGYLEDNFYHIIDSYNHLYTFIEGEDFYWKPNNSYILIPDFTDTLFQKELHYSPNAIYQHFEEQEVNTKRRKIEELLEKDDIITELFMFKICHYELLEKIAYLTPIELERTEEKEIQKRKEYRKD